MLWSTCYNGGPGNESALCAKVYCQPRARPDWGGQLVVYVTPFWGVKPVSPYTPIKDHILADKSNRAVIRVLAGWMSGEAGSEFTVVFWELGDSHEVLQTLEGRSLV